MKDASWLEIAVVVALFVIGVSAIVLATKLAG